jgi:LPS-assembly protein
MDRLGQWFCPHRHRRWIAFLLLWGATVSAYAQPPVVEDDDVWTISADQLHFDKIQNSYLGIGHVSISRKGRSLTADQILLDQTSHEATAEGHVRLVSNGDWLQGDRLHLNLDTEVGQLTGGTLFSAENHLYLSSDTIHKTGPASYWAQKAEVTSCDGDAPAWKITASDLKITVEGYGIAKHAALWARQLPVMYTPFLAFPVKLQRQTGLLTPQLGISTRKGSEFLQPFYWAINQSSDATLYADLMSERGIRTGVEYRYIRTPQSLGLILAEGFTDSKVDDGSGDSSQDWGYSDDAFLRPNEDRYWVRAKINQELPLDFKAKLDLDVVSDQDYLHEFRSGLYGFEQGRTEFLETFGRDLDDDTDPIRSNRLDLSRSWTRYALNMDLRWNDDVIKRRQAETDNTLQQLPTISFRGIRQRISSSPLFFDLASSYTYFYRQDGDRGQRADLYPRLYYPFFVLQGVSVEPSVGLRQTAWRVEADEDGPSTMQDPSDDYRSIYDLKLNLKTEFYRIFNWGAGGGYDRVKHAITPELVYTYIPDADQNDLPRFDTLDRIERQNLITLNLTNTLTLRTPRVSGVEKPQYDYLSFLRFKLSQSFDINKYNEDDPEPFSDLEAEFDLTPGRLVRIDADASWSMYDNRFNTYNASVRLWDRRGDRLDAIYRYTREDTLQNVEPVDSIQFKGQLEVNDRWQLRGAYELNRQDQKAIQTQIGASYQSQCWGVDVNYTIEDESQSYTVMVHLFGLGSFGSQ